MNIYAKVSKKGQITIPKSIRQRMNIGENSAILFIIEKGEVKIKAVPADSAASLVGSLKKFAKKYEPLDKIRAKVQKEISHEADVDQN